MNSDRNAQSDRRIGPGWIIWIVVVLLMQPAAAQYFGRNKVQYDQFHFKVLKSEHFDIYYYSEEAGAAAEAGRMAERWYRRHSILLSDTLNRRQPLILYASHPQFEQTNAIQGQLGEGTGGVTEALKRRIILPFGGPLADTDHVIGHELVHAFQYDITSKGANGIQGPAALQMPLWFIEGMAEYLSIGPYDPHTAMWIRDALQSKRLPKVAQLEDPRYFPYRFGEALLAYIGGRWGDQKIGELLKTATATRDINQAIRKVLSIGPDTLSNDWHAAIHAAYDSLQNITHGPGEYGSALINYKNGGGDLNIAPVLSPDGKKLIFFSEKDFFSINLFLADAETGRIERSIVRSERDPHLESLQFINSAGAWSADGRQVVFASIVRGRPALDLLDVGSAKVVREIRFPTLGEILNPTWSPDGRYVAFSALANGFTDLFIYDLQADSLRRLTDDPFSDLQPAWSPDGGRLAFVTDRFSTHLPKLNTGQYQLATVDVERGLISPLKTLPAGKQINPQWSADGQSIYFISDFNGISNIYRQNLADGSMYRITDLFTGVSGITAISPAISVAASTDRLVFTAFENGKYNLYRVDDPAVRAGVAVNSSDEQQSKGWAQAGWLPPAERPGSRLLAVLGDQETALPSKDEFKNLNYRPRFSLDFVGQPYLAGGVDRFGAQIGGGAAVFWSDMLGNRHLATALQVQSDGRFTDIGGLLGYQNNSRRYNWGAAIQQVPFSFDQFAVGTGEIDGQQAYIEQRLRLRQTNRDVAGFAAYPFSQVSRVEGSLGYQNISFSQKLETRAVDLNTGALILDRSENLPAPSALNLVNASLAFVYDNSFFGATGPIFGQRYRLEISPSLGSLNYYTILADFRRYLLPVRPFTIAFRALHYGRYGGDGEDGRLLPLFIGYQDLLRGYDSNSFSAGECNPVEGDNCPAFSQLFGSRMALANIELRFPPLGLLNLGRGYYGAFPIEMGLFYDAGVAWNSNDKASFLGGARDLVKSYGVAIRVNMFGFAILEFDYVNPVDRPEKGWFWQFNLSPGF